MLEQFYGRVLGVGLVEGYVLGTQHLVNKHPLIGKIMKMYPLHHIPPYLLYLQRHDITINNLHSYPIQPYFQFRSLRTRTHNQTERHLRLRTAILLTVNFLNKSSCLMEMELGIVDYKDLFAILVEDLIDFFLEQELIS